MSRALKAYCLTLLAVAAIFLFREFGWPDNGGLIKGINGVVVLAAVIGILSIIPAMAIWLIFWLIFQTLQARPRLSAVLSAGPTAYFTVYSVDSFMREFSSGFGGPPPPWSDSAETTAVAIIAAVASWIIWTVYPEKVECE